MLEHIEEPSIGEDNPGLLGAQKYKSHGSLYRTSSWAIQEFLEGLIVSNSNGDELETVKQLLLAIARRAEATDSRIDRLVENQDRTQRQLDQFSVKVDQLTENVDIAFQTIEALSNNTDRAINGINDTLASVNAAIERQDRILDYLLKRDGNTNGD